ncbi:hypothetical protein [Arcanobacterium phocae]|uniref:hypothetical protein n=1 Tax=Arcanobacterium phocae TaxID=131112 RepID=UPI001C0EFA74|nr:hypothetical protein [Arcanobacterium phocae]
MIRLVEDRSLEYLSVTVTSVMVDIGFKLGVTKETMWCWYFQEQADTGKKPSADRQESAELHQLREENAELRRANEILKLALICRFRTRPGRQEMVAFIDMYRGRFSPSMSIAE